MPVRTQRKWAVGDGPKVPGVRIGPRPPTHRHGTSFEQGLAGPVDELEELASHRVMIQVVRWQARNDVEQHPVWLNRARYNIRSLEQWESATTAVESYLRSLVVTQGPWICK